MAVTTTRQLLEAGMHFGHQTRRWNPKMARYIYGEKKGIYVIDVKKTLEGIDKAYSFTRDLVARGGVVLFVGTKKQAQEPIAAYAKACGMPYVNERWLGGMLTNFSTISARVRKLQEYEDMDAAGDFDAMPKKEALQYRRELEKFRRNLGGIRTLERTPDAVFIIDTSKEHIAVAEAHKLHIPVVAVVDTNCDPDQINYVIPGNDDAIRASMLVCRAMAEAVAEGRYMRENNLYMPDDSDSDQSGFLAAAQGYVASSDAVEGASAAEEVGGVAGSANMDRVDSTGGAAEGASAEEVGGAGGAEGAEVGAGSGGADSGGAEGAEEGTEEGAGAAEIDMADDTNI